MNIEDDLGHIDEQFIMMDQQLAETISEEMYDTNISDNTVDLDNIEVGESNPFDDWQREAFADMDDLVLDNIDHDVIHLPDIQPVEQHEEPAAEVVEKTEDTILEDHDLFPTAQSQSGSALLEDFDEDLLSQGKMRPDMMKMVKQDVVMPQMSSLPSNTNSSQPFKSEASTSLLDDSAEVNNVINITSPAESKESSVDRDFMEEIEVDEDDEDLIMQVLRESDINFADIPIDIEGLKVEEDLIKLEDIKEETEEEVEEYIEVEDIGYQVSIEDGGAAAKTEIDYDRLHTDIKSKFQDGDDGYSYAEFTLGAQFSDSYNPGFNSHAYENDHSYGHKMMLEETLSSGVQARRQRNISESSGYSSMTDEPAASGEINNNDWPFITNT